MTTTPTVSIGLPVFNGARHIRQAIDSVLAQDYEDFELIIVDNASTDETRTICEEYVQKDSRVRFVCNDSNLGAAPNFNKSFHLANGKYFKWLAYDDWIEPTFLSKSVEILDTHADVSLCHAQTSVYSEEGVIERHYQDRVDGMNDNPRKRFMSTLNRMNMVYQVFGLMRSDQLERSMLIRTIQGADHTLVAEMALQGKIYMIPEYLNANRNTLTVRAARDHRSWWDSGSRAKKRPTYTLLAADHMVAIKRSSISRFSKALLFTQTFLHFLTKYRFVVLREMKVQITTRIPLR